MLSPARVRMMEVFVVVGDNVQLHTGAWDTATKAEIKAALETLESQVYPIYVSEDLDEDGLVTSGRWKIIPDSLAKQPYKRALLQLALRITNSLDTAQERKEVAEYGATMLADGKVTVAEWSKFGSKLGILKGRH